MAFLQFSADLTRTANALELIGCEMRLIREALERLSPSLQPLPEPQPAKLSDLRSTDPYTLSRITSELEEYADEHQVILHSEAFLNSIMTFEQEITSVYGEEAVLELPWNKAAGGRLFAESESHKDRTRTATK